MTPNRVVTLSAFAATICASTTLTAATLITYDFNGDGVGTVAAPYVGVITAGNYDPRTAAIGSDGENTISGFSTAKDNVYMRGSGTTTSTLPIDGTNAYHTFSLTVSGLGANEVLNLTGLSFGYEATGATSGTTFYNSVFSDSIGTPGAQGIDDRLGNELLSTTEGLSISQSVDLTSSNTVAGSTFTGLTNGQTIIFRIYFGDTGTNANDTNAIQRIREPLIISGDVIVVPEPETYALILGAAMGSLLLLRRRQAK